MTAPTHTLATVDRDRLGNPTMIHGRCGAAAPRLAVATMRPWVDCPECLGGDR